MEVISSLKNNLFVVWLSFEGRGETHQFVASDQNFLCIEEEKFVGVHFIHFEKLKRTQTFFMVFSNVL